MLASGSGLATPGTYFDVFWPPVAVTPGNTYALVFGTTVSMCYAGDLGNSYPFGQVYANAGFSGFANFDYTFRTWTDGGFSLSVSGTCPGPVQISVTGATPSGNVAFAYGAAGSFTLPPGPCAGTVLDISSPTLAAIMAADASGNISIAPTLPAGICGRTLQCVDMTTCTTSNTVIL